MSKRGFTLIELLIVMAILGILATVSLANFQSARIKAKDVQRKSDLATIAKSLEAYANDHQLYPRSDSGNNQIICQPPSTDCGWGSSFSDGKSTYAVLLPTDPSGYNYQYVSADGTNFTVYAYLENPNDSSIVTISPAVACGIKNCNYKVTSSNLK